jgi:DHA2 family multidrug resistance protein-like MFS transporter
MPRRLLAVVSITAGSVLYTLDGNIANVALPVIADALRIQQSTAVLLVSTYNLVLAMTLLPLAAIGERLGHRWVFVLGLLAYLVASAGCLLSTGLPMLLAFRTLQALAAAALLSVSLAMVRLVYPAEFLGRGLGFNTMAASLGAACAPPLGGLILAAGPWQTVFAAGMPLALIGLVSSSALPDPEPYSGPYDTKGAALCALTFGLLIVGMQVLSQNAQAWLAWGAIASGLVVAVLFVRHERLITLPVLPVDLLAQPALALSVGGALLAVLSSTILLLYLPFHLHAVGLGSAAVGAMIAPYAVTVMVAAPTSGMLSDRISPNVLGTLGMAIATIGLLAIAWLPEMPTFFDVAWRVALCGLGFSLFFSPNGRLVVGSVPRRRAAGASSLVSTTRMFGQALGSTALAGLLAIDGAAMAPAIVAACLAAFALICSAARIVISPRSQSEALSAMG